jgi:hypothetical protein
MHTLQRFLALILSVILIGGAPPALLRAQDASPALQTPEQLQQLVAPIALYPDSLVAQILAASTYPSQIVEADRWLQQNPNLNGDQLGQAVDQQPWDPSVKALTPFPSVLANMDKNIAWTTQLGDAYVNQQQAVMGSIQEMRQKAQAAGTLSSNAEQKVTTDGQTVVVEPADPQVVYVPAYDPWTVYGASFGEWPGYYYFPPDGIFLTAGAIGFGAGIGIGAFGNWGWGWNHWRSDWGHHDVTFDRHSYVSHSPTVSNRNFNRTAINQTGINRNSFNSGNVNRNTFQRNQAIHPGVAQGAFSGSRQFGVRGNSGVHVGGFHGGGGFRGGGGGGGFHGGGGESHGGGGHR